MPTLDTIAAFAPLFDVLALAACLMMLCFLVLNRLKYGRLYLERPGAAGKGAFAGEVALQLMSLQSRKVYDNLQRALAREFASLCTTGDGCLPAATAEPGGEGFAHTTGRGSSAGRRHCYRRAEDMLRQGADAEAILRHCGIAESELVLLQGLHQLAEEGRVEG
jgi:hypothetical protein